MNLAALLSTQGSQYEVIRSVLAGTYVALMGVVDSVIDKTHIDAKLWFSEYYSGPSIIKNVELMPLGGNAFRLELPATKGDIVLLIGLKHPVEQLKTSAQKDELCLSGQSYTLGTVKALQIADFSVESRGSFVVDADGNVTINNKLKVLV